MENVLSQELAYFDFAGHFLRQDLNILEKAKVFEGVWDGFVEHDALFLKRVALNGSGPIRVIWDNYVQKEREMIYLMII